VGEVKDVRFPLFGRSKERLTRGKANSQRFGLLNRKLRGRGVNKPDGIDRKGNTVKGGKKVAKKSI